MVSNNGKMILTVIQLQDDRKKPLVPAYIN